MPGQDKKATLEQAKSYMKDGLETVTNKMGIAATAVSQQANFSHKQISDLHAAAAAPGRHLARIEMATFCAQGV